MERLSNQADSVYDLAVEIANKMMHQFYTSPVYNGLQDQVDATDRNTAILERIAIALETKQPVVQPTFVDNSLFSNQYRKARSDLKITEMEMFTLMSDDVSATAWLNKVRDDRVNANAEVTEVEETKVIQSENNPEKAMIVPEAVPKKRRKWTNENIFAEISAWIEQGGVLSKAGQFAIFNKSCYTTCMVRFQDDNKKCKWQYVIDAYVKAL
jgi:hypothetical protein